MDQDPYLAALELVRKNSGTSGQAALAKGILSLYNQRHAFSLGEVLGPIVGEFSEVMLAMISDYAKYGETEELRHAGAYVYANFPHLIELSNAMFDARARVRQEWDRQDEEEMRRLYPNDFA